jgi:hypothetical protein
LPYRFASRHARVIAFFALIALLAQTIAGSWATFEGATANGDVTSVICHGESGNVPSDAPAPSKSCEFCCICCTAVTVATAAVLEVSRLNPRPIARVASPQRLFVTLRVGVVRAGRSQAPPSLA